MVFDLGNTLIEQRVDDQQSLDQMELRLLPGVSEALQVLRSRYRLSVLSNTSQSSGKAVRRALDKLSVGSVFDIIITSVDAGYAKPDQRIFDRVLKELRLSPGQTLMIGNDPIQDIEPARKLGMWTGYFLLPGHESISFVGANFSFSSFSMLPSLIATLRSSNRDN